MQCFYANKKYYTQLILKLERIQSVGMFGDKSNKEPNRVETDDKIKREYMLSYKRKNIRTVSSTQDSNMVRRQGSII